MKSDKVTTAPVARPQERPRPTVGFPFRLTLEHPPVDLRGMFRLTHAFDLYEVRGVAGENVDHARKDITVDVLEVTPTTTTLHITPANAMTYEALAAEVEALVKGIADRHLGGHAKAAKLQWLVDPIGITSDMRGRIRAVQ